MLRNISPSDVVWTGCGRGGPVVEFVTAQARHCESIGRYLLLFHLLLCIYIYLFIYLFIIHFLILIDSHHPLLTRASPNGYGRISLVRPLSQKR